MAVLAVGGFTYYRQAREADAERALAAALATFGAPVAGEAPQDAAPGAVRFASASEKFKQAAAELDGVNRRYGSMDAGRRARYYAALCRLELGETAEAEKALTELSSGDKAPSSPRSRGWRWRTRIAGPARWTRRSRRYQQMADDATLAVPRDHVLDGAVPHARGRRRLPEAGAAYRRVANEFPTSPYAAEARERADYLEGASRG